MTAIPELIIDPNSDLYQQQIRPTLEGIEGWLAEPACHYTAWLMAQQNREGIPGGIVELGVYRGRYLALLYLCGLAAQRTLVGVDIFSGVGSRHNAASIAAVKLTLQDAARKAGLAPGDEAKLHVLAADTLELKAEEVLPLLAPHQAAFISVDGGHEAIHLVNDLELAALMLGPGGIVAVDDAFNFSTPGAIEGTCRWFDTRNQGRLAPFAHCYNKLFLCRSAEHGKWLQLTRDFVQAHKDTEFGQRTIQRMNENRTIGFAPRFFDREIVPFL